MPYVLTLLSDELMDVLVLAGWSRRRLKEQEFLEKFKESLTIIANTVLRLQTAVGEDVTSGDLTPYIVLSNAEFDPHTMEDGFPQDREGHGPATGRLGERVAGTTDIGLRRSVKGSAFFDLSKPKVVLCSALAEQ